MEMSSWWPMPKVVGLTTYTDQRNSSSCADSVSMEECERVVLGSKWHNWYYADLMFGQNSIIFLCVGLGVFTLANVVFRLRQHKYGRGLGNDPIYIWLAGLSRYAGSRQWRLSRRRGYTLTLGQSTIISLLILFFSVMTLAPKPYYWPDLSNFGGSPPIATRSGYMAIAILPFQVLLATKWNLISCLTGVSHDKLQVFHRWMGWIMYVLALIHTFPFIIVDRKLGMMDMIMQTDWYTVSGIITLVPQTLLVSLSIAPIRNRAYELFKGIHFILAAFFIVFLFLHCGFTMTSALYFVGLAAAYYFSFLIRLLILIRNGSPLATLTLSTSSSTSPTSAPATSLVHITIPTSTSSRLDWKAGQHYLVRFLTKDAHMFSSHPFTAASAPGDGRLEFVIKPAKGMTRALMSKVQGAEQNGGGDREGRKMEVRVLLDGPYGGIGGDIGAYDRVVLVAGGSGISFLLGTLSHLTHQASLASRHVTIIYTTRDAGLSFPGTLPKQSHQAEPAGLAEHYRTILSQLATRLSTAHAQTRVEIFCHLSFLSPASPDWDPEQAALVSEKVTVDNSAISANGMPAAKPEGAGPCCCGPAPTDSEISSEKRENNNIQPVALDKQKEGDASDSDSSYSRSPADMDRSYPEDQGVNASLRSGRPDMGAHISRLTTYYGTAAIAICGPRELVYEARNAVADEQLKIVRGDVACTDLYLHTEVFEW